MKNKGCSLSGPLMLKAKSSEKFAKFWPLKGPWRSGVWNVAIFTAKGTSLREFTSIEPFCMKIGWAVWPLGQWGNKSQKVTRGSHRNDVSPLAQGLRYRAPVICSVPIISETAGDSDLVTLWDGASAVISFPDLTLYLSIIQWRIILTLVS